MNAPANVPTAATVYLSLGSNLGDRAANLQAAIAALPSAGIQPQKLSSFYETAPVDYVDQPWFLNCAVQATTLLAPIPLLQALRSIEDRLGSKKAFAKGPRLLDIDILIYSDQTIAIPELQIPHPRMLQRKFVLLPLAEIAPNLHHPSWPPGLTASEALRATPDTSEVRLFSL